MRTRQERRRLTTKKLNKRKKLMKDLGLQAGTVYKRHVDKVNASTHYMHKGHITHYISCGFKRKPKYQKLQKELLDMVRRDKV